MQNSQRVLLAKPRTAPRRGGAMRTSRPTATGHERCARQRGAGGACGNGGGGGVRGHGARAVRTATGRGGACFLRAHFENHKEQRGRAFVFLSLHRNGLCVPLCSFSRGAGPHHGALCRESGVAAPVCAKRLRRTFQLTKSVTYANMNATRDEFLFRPCGKFPFDKSSISRFSIP